MRLLSVLYLCGILLIFSCTSSSDDLNAEPEAPSQNQNPDNDDDGTDDETDGDNGDSENDGGGDNEGDGDETNDGNWIIFNSENSPLVNDVITDIEFDSQGSAWMVTYFNSNANGIVKFDGENWTTYNSANSGIGSDLVVDMVIDDVDAKWIATRRNGLSWNKNEEWINYSTSNSDIPSDDLTTIDIDDDGLVWIGTKENGLISYKGGEWESYNLENSGLTSNYISAISIDDNNVVWALTQNELVRVSEAELNVYPYAEDFRVGWRTIAFNNDEVWIGAGYGIASFINNEWNYFNYFNDDNCLTDCQIEKIIFVENQLWIGNFRECSSGGILNFTECVSFTKENSELPANPVWTINIDSEGRFWIATYGGGIAIWERE